LEIVAADLPTASANTVAPLSPISFPLKLTTASLVSLAVSTSTRASTPASSILLSFK